jgi:hypothetical protein
MDEWRRAEPFRARSRGEIMAWGLREDLKRRLAQNYDVRPDVTSCIESSESCVASDVMRLREHELRGMPPEGGGQTGTRER